jgi:hypothetical protein
LEPLLRNVEAAEVRQVVLAVGDLESAQVAALVRTQRESSMAGLLELAKAFGIDPMILLGAVPVTLDAHESRARGRDLHRLKPRRAAALIHGLEQLVRTTKLELPACGCGAHCALSSPRAANQYEVGYESVMGRDLFAGLAY